MHNNLSMDSLDIPAALKQFYIENPDFFNQEKINIFLKQPTKFINKRNLAKDTYFILDPIWLGDQAHVYCEFLHNWQNARFELELSNYELTALAVLNYYPNVKKFVFLWPQENTCMLKYDFLKDLECTNKLVKLYSNQKAEVILVDNIIDYNKLTGINNLTPYEEKIAQLFKSTDISVIGWSDFFAYYRYTDPNLKQQIDEVALSSKAWTRITISPAGKLTPIQESVPTKLFTSLNHNIKPHREIMIDYMYKEGLFPYGYISRAEEKYFTKDSYNFRWWSPKVLILDVDFNSPEWSPGTTTIPVKQFKNSVFSIINETTDSNVFLTEKTWLTIRCKRPFIINGARYSHKYLESIGYKLFDELIDYSFDSIEDTEERIKLIVKEIKKLTSFSNDLNGLYEKLKPKIEHNYFTLINQIATNKLISPELKEILRSNYSYLSTNIFDSPLRTNENKHWSEFRNLDFETYLDDYFQFPVSKIII